MHLTEIYENCMFIETSAKKNINIEESFTRIFDLGNLPLEMSPSQHRKVHPFYVSGSSSPTGRKGMSIRRKMSDACGTIAPNVRRPSIRTDLMVAQMRTKTSAISKADVKEKCVIQWRTWHVTVRSKRFLYWDRYLFSGDTHWYIYLNSNISIIKCFLLIFMIEKFVYSSPFLHILLVCLLHPQISRNR